MINLQPKLLFLLLGLVLPLAADPATTQKRLGDGFYEQKLLREQVAQLTGRRFLEGYSNDEAQFRALMDAGVAYAQEYHLIPGIALSGEQMAQLTRDIVWLVEQEVRLADGSTQKVLVPQLYARVKDGDLSASGALLAGHSVDLNLSGDLVNSGTIAASQSLSLTADNLRNQGGSLLGQTLDLRVQTDLSGATKVTGAAGEKAVEAAEAIGQHLDETLNEAAHQALLKSGGVVDPHTGEPILDLKQLTTEQKGAFGELFGENLVKQIVPDGQKLARSPGIGETGIDDLYKVNRPDVDYVHIEYKFVGNETTKGSGRLGDTQDGKQGRATNTTPATCCARMVPAPIPPGLSPRKGCGLGCWARNSDLGHELLNYSSAIFTEQPPCDSSMSRPTSPSRKSSAATAARMSCSASSMPCSTTTARAS